MKTILITLVMFLALAGSASADFLGFWAYWNYYRGTSGVGSTTITDYILINASNAAFFDGTNIIIIPGS